MIQSHDSDLINEWMRQYRAPKAKPGSAEALVDICVSKFQRRKLCQFLSRVDLGIPPPANDTLENHVDELLEKEERMLLDKRAAWRRGSAEVIIGGVRLELERLAAFLKRT
jgi:hypothetical protein